MKRVACFIVVAVAAALLPQSARAADATDVLPVRKAIAALVAHDKPTVIAQFDSNAKVLDAFAVYAFDTPAAWVDGFVEATKTKYHDVKIVLAAQPKFNLQDHASAYVVLPATLTATIAGARYSNSGRIAATLSHMSGSWKITSLAYAKEDERGGAPLPAAPSGVEETVRRAIDGFNANNMAQTNAQFDPNATFIDEFPQFSWIGTEAVDKYNVALAKMINGMHLTNVKETIGTIRFSMSEATTAKNAYIVVPLTVTATTATGEPYQETGHQVYGLRKQNGAWKILAQAYVKDT